ncbi:MAG TPA: hypothetical protein VK403_05025 [Allosphingosinicella sp.]|nr:hypothetical protein [Allosphingosinicella sp.]
MDTDTLPVRFALSRLPADIKTPSFVFDPEVVQTRLDALKRALGGGVIVSIKANPLVDVFVRCTHAFTDGVEVASIGELNLVIGRLSAPRFVNTPALDPELMAAAHASRSTIILDNPELVDTYAARFTADPARARLMLRANAGELVGGKLGARYRDQFGMDGRTLIDSARRLVQAGYKLSGLSVFGGSNSFADLALPIAGAIGALVAEVEASTGARLELLNLGGGLPADWEQADLPFAQYRAKLGELPPHLSIMHEAGRALFAAAGVFAVRLVTIKSIAGRRIGVCDGGLAQCFLLAQTESLMKRPKRGILLERRANNADDPSMLELVGNSCSRADVIGELDCSEGEPQPGDIVLFENCGAYHTYSPTGFLNLRPAARYVVS